MNAFVKYGSFFPDIDVCAKTIEGKNGFNLKKRFGTPLFIVSKKALISKINWLKKTLNLAYPNSKLAFSVKTNNLAGIVGLMRKKKIMAEVVSPYEYLLAKKVGYEGKQIIVNGTNKSADLLDMAIKDSALVNIDNINELKHAIIIAGRLGIKSRVGLRVRPKIFGSNSRFGFATEEKEFPEALRLINSNSCVELLGLHCHLGSNIFSLSMYRQASETICGLIRKIENQSASGIKYIDMGGGFPSAGGGGSDVSAELTYSGGYFKEIAKPILNLGLRNIQLIVEPGRALIDESIILLSSVISSRTTDRYQAAVVDASINILPLAQTRNQKVDILLEKATSGQTLNDQSTIFFGSSCQEVDWLTKTRQTYLRSGDLAVFYNAGAYNISQANQFISLRPAIIGISGNKIKLLRRKEVFTDLYRLEKNSL